MKTSDPVTIFAVICAAYAVGLVGDYVLGSILSKKDPEKYRKLKWALVGGYLAPIVPLLYATAGALPLTAILAPSLGAAALSYIIHFLRFRLAAERNPYRGEEREL